LTEQKSFSEKQESLLKQEPPVNDVRAGAGQMKQTLILFAGLMISGSLAHAADMKVSVTTSTGLGAKPTTKFAADCPKVHAIIKTTGVQKGAKFRAVWIAEDVGEKAPANTKIEETATSLDSDTDKADFSLSKPTNGWPSGKYRVEIYANDKLATKAKFTIGDEDTGDEASTSSDSVKAGKGSRKGGKVKFPTNNPTFTVEFPPQWTCTPGKDGSLDCKAGTDETYVFSMVSLEQIHSTKELKPVLPDVAKTMATAMKLKDFELGDVEKDENGNGVSFIGIAGAGSAEGLDFEVVVHAFEPQKGKFAAIISAATKEANEKHHEEYDDVTASITPIEE
jgi:hypothetical protein